jgi:hypothetical protein
MTGCRLFQFQRFNFWLTFPFSGIEVGMNNTLRGTQIDPGVLIIASGLAFA